jgi:hypothetical protein
VMPSVEERPSAGERLVVALVRKDPSIRTKNDKEKREKRAENDAYALQLLVSALLTRPKAEKTRSK